MKLVSEWRHVLRHAWSIRLAILAGALSGLEAALPYLSDDMPRQLFAALSLIVSAGAVVARCVAQPRMRNDAEQS